MHNRYQKRWKKNFLIFIYLFLTIWIISGLYLNLANTNYKQLESVGYSNKQISIINDLLTKKEQKLLYHYDYLPYIDTLLLDEKFEENKLENYLKYFRDFPQINCQKLIFMVNNGFYDLQYNEFLEDIINHKDFKKENITRYSNYQAKYNLNVDDTIYGVNHNLDKYDIKLTKEDQKYIETDYFIPQNLERYHAFADQNKKLKVREIVEAVNNNNDQKTYQEQVKSNLDDQEKILVNKYYYLGDYEPKDLITIDSKYGQGQIKEEVYQAFIDMYRDALNDNYSLYIVSGYISYQEQKKLYALNHKKYERAGYADSATGLSVNLSTYNDQNCDNFSKYPEKKWMDANAYKYGFILRYPSDKEKYTGYDRPYQYRYVGKQIAKEIFEHKITFDEYYEYYIKKRT